MEIHSAILQVHVVFQHVQEFLEMVNTDPNQPALGMVEYMVKIAWIIVFILTGLGYFSEQSFESMHHDVKVC